MKSGNRIKDVAQKVREYYKKHGRYPKGKFQITKNNAFRKSAKGDITVD